jgi:hypothetical protein
MYMLLGGPFEATYINYEGTPWAKSAEAPGALPAMLGAWLLGGLVLAAITGVGMMVLLRGGKRPEQASEA